MLSLIAKDRAVTFEGHNFFSLYCILIVKFLNFELPQLANMIHTTSSMSALNKEIPSVRLTRHNMGLPPKLRPLACPSSTAKLGLTHAKSSAPLKRVIDALAPLQKGQGMRRGPEIVAHTSQAMFSAGHIVFKDDKARAFQENERSKLFDAVEKHCPELLDIFNASYGHDSPCLYTVDGEVHIIWSKNGTRMGCILGSIGFNLTHMDGYQRIQDAFPDIIFNALTDDTTGGFAPRTESMLGDGSATQLLKRSLPTSLSLTIFSRRSKKKVS
jgi:hypothetical protein